MKKKILIIFALVLCCAMMAIAEDSQKTNPTPDYKSSPEYISLRNAMHRAFNDGDSAHFSTAVRQLEKYLLKQNDLHAYYTQRCNEIVFELNRQNIYEAYMLAIKLSHELTERKLDKEMYMAINMMGHIYHFSGNNASAKRCFWEVIRRMEQEGYLESIPPIYMNLVNIVIDEDPDEALRLIEQAASVARESSPEREFDIETRRTLAYYRMGDMERFNKGYQDYLKGEALRLLNWLTRHSTTVILPWPKSMPLQVDGKKPSRYRKRIWQRPTPSTACCLAARCKVSKMRFSDMRLSASKPVVTSMPL